MRLPLLLAATALMVSGCTGAPGEEGPAPGPDLATAERSGEKYVALGDSFTAGPFVPTTDLAGGCLRSDHNYPSLLAEELDIEDFVDVSCSGARTRDLPREQRTVRDARVPPQLDALSPDTTLVTLGIGGNDFDLYGDLTNACLRLRDTDPTGSPCRDAMTRGEGPNLATVTARIGRNVERGLAQVARRAPDARVVLVGDPRIAPSTGECPELLPYATGDVPFGDEVLRRLTAALSRAADRAGVEFLDMYAASAGHDVCSAEPYVNGVNGDQDRAAAFHPFPRGMRAVAHELAALLASP
ncbi:MAG: SGNH/GDSL hydrolase family protein [Nocardioides sp.]